MLRDLGSDMAESYFHLCSEEPVVFDEGIYIWLELFVGPFFSCKCLETTPEMQKSYFLLFNEWNPPWYKEPA